MMKGKPKQKSKKQKANAVLQKFRAAVDEFVKSKSGAEEAENDRGLRFVKWKSRKEVRKEKRKLKKARMKSHYEGKKSTSSPEEVGKQSSSPADKKQLKTRKTEETRKDASKVQTFIDPVNKFTSSKTATKPSTKKPNRLQESRKRALLEANEDEDREIKRLERCLGFKKRKNKKNLPRSFVADGLDYILGMLDSDSVSAKVYEDDMDTAKENLEKLGEDESQLSGGDDEEEKMSSEASDEGSLDENDSEEEESDEDQMVDDEKNPATSDDGSEMDEDEEGANTSDPAKSESVCSEIPLYLDWLYTRSNRHLPSSRWILQPVNTFLLTCEPTKVAKGKRSFRG